MHTPDTQSGRFSLSTVLCLAALLLACGCTSTPPAAWENTGVVDAPYNRVYEDVVEFVRTVATARITMPKSMVRLSAGRESMSESTQALCFLAGANSIFIGDKLLTAPNAGDDSDAALFAKLGMTALKGEEPMRAEKAMVPV